MTRFPELSPLHKGIFVQRPNRFVVHCQLPDRGTVVAHMPNPGRMGELLLPGATMYLTESDNPERKTPFTAVAVERNGKSVFLHTHFNNTVARHLIEAGRIPGLKSARVVKAEAKHGNSRFDFLLEHQGAQRYLEVKSVTLFGNGIAMFPDAPTLRGRKHLTELATLATKKSKSIVLFLVHSLDCDYFIPDYHTDLPFAQTLYDLRHQLQIIPVAIGWTRGLQLKDETRLLPIPWAHTKRHFVDRGVLVHVFEHEDSATIAVESVDNNIDRFSRSSVSATLRRLSDFPRESTEITKHHCFPIRNPHASGEAFIDTLSKTFPWLTIKSGSDTAYFVLPSNPLADPNFQLALEAGRLVAP